MCKWLIYQSVLIFIIHFVRAIFQWRQFLLANFAPIIYPIIHITE